MPFAMLLTYSGSALVELIRIRFVKSQTVRKSSIRVTISTINILTNVYI